MAYFSPFWKRHYDDVSFCCTFYPFENVPVWGTSGKLMPDFIDTPWMGNEGLKWVGWDDQGWFIWIAPAGKVYRFPDLRRNQAGKQYEKDVQKLDIPGDGLGRGPQPPDGMSLFEWELEVQKKCGFCPKGADSSDKKQRNRETLLGLNSQDDDSDGSGNEQKKDEKKYYQEQDENSFVPTLKNNTTDSSDVTDTGKVTGKDQSENNGDNSKQKKYEYSNQYTPKEQKNTKSPSYPKEVNNKSAATNKLPATSSKNQVTYSPAVPAKRRNFRYIDQPEEDFDFNPTAKKEKKDEKKVVSRPDPCPTRKGLAEMYNNFQDYAALIAAGKYSEAVGLLTRFWEVGKIATQNNLTYRFDREEEYGMWVSIKQSNGLQIIETGRGDLRRMTIDFEYFLEGVYGLIHENIHAWQKGIGRIDNHEEREMLAHYFNLYPSEFMYWRSLNYPDSTPLCIDFLDMSDRFIDRHVKNTRPSKKILIDQFLHYYDSLPENLKRKYTTLKNQIDYLNERFN